MVLYTICIVGGRDPAQPTTEANMTRIDRTFALSALALAGIATTAAIVDIIDTIEEAIEAARPAWGGDLVSLHADRLALAIAE